MSKLTWFLFFFAVALAIPCFILFFTSGVVGYDYSGRVVFGSEQEYQQFKQWLLDNPGVEFTGEARQGGIRQLAALSSEPPIIVEFEYLGVPRGVTFPYPYATMRDGRKENADTTDVLALCGLGAVVACVVSYFTSRR